MELCLSQKEIISVYLEEKLFVLIYLEMEVMFDASASDLQPSAIILLLQHQMSSYRIHILMLRTELRQKVELRTDSK